MLRRAMRDLRTIELWRPLTRRLFVLRIRIRPDPEAVPTDGHLADAALGTYVDPTGAGRICRVRIWPAALATDLVNQQRYYRAGRLGFSPPSERVFWAAILGHELGHCLGRKEVTPEPAALRWEDRVKAVLQAKLES